MNYIGISELKQSKKMWEMLSHERELVLTHDGKPEALIIKISPKNLEATVTAIRRAIFSENISTIRDRAANCLPSSEEIELEIQDSRKNRK